MYLCTLRSSLIARLAGTPKSFASPKLSLLLSLFRENLLVLFSTLEIEVITLFLFKKTNFLLISLSLSLFLYSVFMVRNSAYKCAVVGLGGLEPPTSRLSGVRSNHLSYKPICLSL